MTRLNVSLLLGSFALSACAADHEFRVASVGEPSISSSDAPEALPESRKAPILIASGGGVLLGTPGIAQPVTGSAAPGTSGGVTTGSVTGILPSTGQAVVQLTDGTSLLVNQTTASVGQAVAISGQGNVIGSVTGGVPQVLAGARPVGGTQTVLSPVLRPVSSTLRPITSALSQPGSTTSTVTPPATSTLQGAGSMLGIP